jgi:hypothetical protein
MGDQYVLYPINLLHLCRFRIHPINGYILAGVRESLLVRFAEKAVKIDPPVPVVLPPPIEIDMVARL